MLFSSITFLFYFLPIVLLVDRILTPSRRAQNIWLFIVSIFFYAWGEPVFVLLMLGSILANWALGLAVDKVRTDKRKAKLVIAITCILNIGVLFIFKYLGFVIRNINAISGRTLIDFAGIALPLGISFFTFQAMSYVIDVYRNDAKVEKNPFYVGLYVAFFPQLVAGPIVRYTDIASEIHERTVSWALFSEGCCQFVAGMGKKVILANGMAAVADRIFDLSAISYYQYSVPVTMAWLGIFSYTLQIYLDFSGYSDMAIGLGKMFGFHFKKNFDYPYISQSVSEFWRRWHISLSTWFKEYVYIPLGGSRMENNDLMVRNTLIVWALTGIWHGAEWTFILWGLWNFLFITLERVIRFNELDIPRAVRHIYLMTVVCLGWMLFRVTDVYQATRYMLNVLGLSHNGFFSETALMFVREYWLFYLGAIFFSLPIAKKMSEWLRVGDSGKWGSVFSALYPITYTVVFVICITYLAKGNYNPFIYFNF